MGRDDLGDFADFADFVAFAAFAGLDAFAGFEALVDFEALEAADLVVDDFLALPTTLTTPGPGTKLVSSPVDQRTLSRLPVIPVTTPSRAGWPDLLGSTLTLSPTDAIVAS